MIKSLWQKQHGPSSYPLLRGMIDTVIHIARSNRLSRSLFGTHVVPNNMLMWDPVFFRRRMLDKLVVRSSSSSSSSSRSSGRISGDSTLEDRKWDAILALALHQQRKGKLQVNQIGSESVRGGNFWVRCLSGSVLV